MVEMPATFSDKRGSECVSIQTTGTSLATTIRGIGFTGEDFDSLSPLEATDLFSLCGGCLCGCRLMVGIPVRLVTPQELRRAIIQADIVLGEPVPNGGLDNETIQVRLAQPEFTVVSGGDSGWFEGELLSLVAQLPIGFSIEACITCGLSDYSPYGHGCFGSMACFRGAAEDYRRVCSKADIFAIWGRLTEYVQETHYCPHYEPRPAGRGYRG